MADEPASLRDADSHSQQGIAGQREELPQSAKTRPSGTSSSFSQDSTFGQSGILKDVGKAQEQLDRAEVERSRLQNQTSNGYIDSSGNLKHITPSPNVNLNQFYPTIDLQTSTVRKEEMEQLAADTWGSRKSTSDTRLGIIVEGSPTAEVEQVSLFLLVHFL